MSVSSTKSMQNPIISKIIECTVLDYRKSTKPDPVQQPLHLIVERCTGGSETFRVQISHETDLSFLYREEITQSKFQSLANEWRLSRDLRNDINEFFQYSLREMITKSKVDAKLIVQQTGDTCTLELETQEKLAMLKISIILKLVAGEELEHFLMDEIMRLRRRVKKQGEELSVKNELENKASRTEKELKEVQDRLKGLDAELAKKTKIIDQVNRQLDERLEDLQLAHEEITVLTNRFKEVDQECNDAIKDIDAWKVNYEQLSESNRDLLSRYTQEVYTKDREIDKLKHDLKKYDGIIAKYHSTPISISESKVKELEDSNRQKDEEIANLQKQSTDRSRTIEELMKKNAELSGKLRKKVEEIDKLSKLFNTQLFAPSLLATAMQSTPQVGMPNSEWRDALFSTSPIIRNPQVPISQSETPALDQEKRSKEQAGRQKGKENLKK